MKDYAEIAAKNFHSGYNCAQAVFAAFCDRYNMDEKTALKLSSSFGGGMGRLREVCGAMSAVFMIAGLEKGYFDVTNYDLKAVHYKFIQELAADFREKFNTIICRELLNLPKGPDAPEPLERTKEYYAHRPCEKFIRYAAQIVQNKILDK